MRRVAVPGEWDRWEWCEDRTHQVSDGCGQLWLWVCVARWLMTEVRSEVMKRTERLHPETEKPRDRRVCPESPRGSSKLWQVPHLSFGDLFHTCDPGPGEYGMLYTKRAWCEGRRWAEDPSQAQFQNLYYYRVDI